MKNKTLNVMAMVIGIIIVSLFLTSCFDQKTKQEPTKQTIQVVNNITNPEQVACQQNAELATNSILEFICTSSYKGRVESWKGQCCLYANRGDESFIALPSHVFPYDERKYYDIYLIDVKKDTIHAEWSMANSFEEYDAKMLVVKKIPGIIPLCNTKLIRNKPVRQNSLAILVTPFNVRGVTQKEGNIIANGEMEMKTLSAEPGDSGALIVNEDGVLGIVWSITDDGKTNYVPINLFEKLYSHIIIQQQK